MSNGNRGKKMFRSPAEAEALAAADLAGVIDRRAPKLTLAVIDRLSEALRAGNFAEAACEYAGISYQQYRRWLLAAEEPDASDLLIEFREAVVKARATAEIRNVAMIQRAAQDPKLWSAAAWWLERSNPQRWGKRQTIAQEISGPNGAPIQIDNPREYLLSILAADAGDDDGTESLANPEAQVAE